MIEATVGGHARPRRRRPIAAALGPCIHARCYEFGADRPRPRGRRARRRRCGPPPRAGTPALDLAAGVAAALPRPAASTLDDAGHLHRVQPRATGRTGPGATPAARRSWPGSSREPPPVDPADAGRARVDAGARPDRRRRRRSRRRRPLRGRHQGLRARGGAGRRGRPASSTSARTTPRSWWPRRRSWPPTRRRPVRWHFIGRLQRNKVRALAPCVAPVAERRPARPRRRDRQRAPGRRACWCRSTCPTSPRRAAARPTRPPRWWPRLGDARASTSQGLMAVGPHRPPDERPAGLRRRCVALADDLDLPVRSMGMTGDLEVAVAEGRHHGPGRARPVRPSTSRACVARPVIRR